MGSDFDPKEEVFRNYAGLLGPLTDVVLRVHWSEGEDDPTSIVKIGFIDPALNVAIVYDHEVKAGIMNLKPELRKPLRPGMWTVRLATSQHTVFAETSFVIIPLAVDNGLPVADENVERIHNGPPDGLYSERNYADYFSFFGLSEADQITRSEKSQANARLNGASLIEWIDELVDSWWLVKSSCLANAKSRSARCQHLPLCAAVSWSSHSPDPKSQL